MDVNQIYTIVNSITDQAIGKEGLTTVSEQGLISLGNIVLDSSTYTEAFLNTLVRRIGKTIISSRAYKSKFDYLMKDSFEWGSILQKIKVRMPKAEADESYGLVDGSTVDHYKINKPKASQKLFVTETPYQFHITIQREHLKTAFTGAAAMASFIGAVYTEVQNALELALEELGRTCLCNYMAELWTLPSPEEENQDPIPGSRVINLVTEYNTLRPTATVTSANCLFDSDFLRYAVRRMKEISNKMTYMTTGLFNDGTETRHTPKNLQRILVLDELQDALETNVLYSAFNYDFVQLPGFERVAFWQAIEEPASFDVARSSDNTNIVCENVVATIFDTDAMGMYKKDEWVSTTPFNSAGGYANSYWHERQLWVNDLSENMVIFTLN